METAKAKALRKRLDSKILKLIAPFEMSIEEYKIRCNLNNIDPSVENGMFLHWVMTAGGDDAEVVEKVENAIVNALERGYLLDTSNAAQCEYFCDAVCDLVLKDKWYTKRLLEAVLKNYASSSGYAADVYKYCRRLNKSIGLTSVGYFCNGGLGKMPA